MRRLYVTLPALTTNIIHSQIKDVFHALRTVLSVTTKTSAQLARMIQLFLSKRLVNLVRNVQTTAKLALSILSAFKNVINALTHSHLQQIRNVFKLAHLPNTLILAQEFVLIVEASA